MRRGEVWHYEPVINRAGRSTDRLIVSSNSINSTELPTVLVVHIVDRDPESLLAVRIGDRGWAVATAIERPVRKRLTERVGEATAAEMEQLDNALRATFDL